MELSSLEASATPCHLPPRNMGTNEPDNLFLGIKNPDLEANIESSAPLGAAEEVTPDILIP